MCSLRLATWSYEGIEALALMHMCDESCHGLSQWPGGLQNFLVPSAVLVRVVSIAVPGPIK
jgi:hypothetical protein